MAEVHHLIVQQGVEEARRQAATKHERALVEAAYQVMSEEADKLGFTYSGFALTSLPHKPQVEMALAVYPEAQVSMGEKGITLRPSRPAVGRG